MSRLNFFSFTLFSGLLVIILPLGILVESKGCSINAIYSFGDSIADTGNLLQEGPVGFFASIGSYPYGESYKKPTGRCSDGLLIIDYLGTYFTYYQILYFSTVVHSTYSVYIIKKAALVIFAKIPLEFSSL
jgi:hypothetical protein